MYTNPSIPSLVDVCLITLSFNSAFPSSSSGSPAYSALNAVLNNITDDLLQTPHFTNFTEWSPCLTSPHKVAILTTASDACSDTASHIFEPVLRYLSTPPSVLHVLLDYSIRTLATSSPEQKISCDIIVLRAPTPGIAGAVGKRFGWDPKHSSLSKQMLLGAPGAFSRPGDLLKDWWAWAELRDAGDPGSPQLSSSLGSEGEGMLRSTNSDEKNMSTFFPEEEDEEYERKHEKMDDETLVMLFQWRNHDGADRFKHPLQKSYGLNDQEVSPDLWDRHVAHPVRQLEGVGAQVDTLKLELRVVEERIFEPGQNGANAGGGGRGRSESRTLGVIATGLGERVGGFWR
jgi:hypothetical protein